MTRPNKEWANDFCEIAGIMRRWHLKGVKHAYARVSALQARLLDGKECDIMVSAGVREAAAELIDLISETEEGEDDGLSNNK